MKLTNFWNRRPAFLYGLSALLGILFALQSPLALLPLPFLVDRKRCFTVIILFFLPIAYLHNLYFFPSSGEMVSGVFQIHSIREGKNHAQGWIYQGTLKTLEGRINCRIHSKTRHLANHNFSIKGRAFTQNGRFYTIKNVEWKDKGKKFNLSEPRYHAKQWVKSYIQNQIKQERAAQFLTGMVTGELEDKVMFQEFGNLGLSHIMAISGFHFALLTFFFHILLCFIFLPKCEAIVLMILLTLYLCFIGDTPSIQRAWCVALVFLIGQVVERPSDPLNSIGVAMIMAIIINPLSVTTLSFQLSFLATAGILLAYRPVNHLLQLWIPRYSFKTVRKMPLVWQHGYLFSNLFRNALALTLAVHLALLPLLVHCFKYFSLNSLVFNLFFPFLAGIALFLFMTGVLCGGILHPLNGWYCERLLTLTEYPPIFFKTIYIEKIPDFILVIYIVSFFIFIICYNENYDGAYQEKITRKE